MSSYAFVLGIIFLAVVLPVWITFHYRSKNRVDGLSAEDVEKLDALVTRLESMTERISNLEKILDAESDEWRNK